MKQCHRIILVTRLIQILAGLIVGGATTLHAQAAVQSGIAEVNGTTLYYEITGSGHPLVLIHGGAVDSRAWDRQFGEFARDYKVIRYDLRGTGRSGDRDQPFNNAEDLRALLEYLEIDKAHLLGISRGGGFAYDYTLEHPDRVTALVLVSSNLSVRVPAYHEMFERATETGKAHGAEAAAAVWAGDPFQGPQRKDAYPRVHEIMTDNMPRFRYFDGYEPVEQLSYSGAPRSERLGEIRVPTLVIAGAHDNEVARANYQRWAEGIHEARMIVFSEAAHLVPIDQPEDFNRVVLEFFSEVNE